MAEQGDTDPPVGSVWTKSMPYVGTDEDGEAIVGTQTVTRRFMERGMWFVEYVTTFPGTHRQGYGICEA
ncbi:hypothetical protein AB0A95_33930, partial [Micromonospora sp. NPDC049230]|uniref:hypothetical protein n=1 Tax=Micromonospora sp. NPDC049230 TaxID=3155502 RepID=UPI0033E93E0F